MAQGSRADIFLERRSYRRRRIVDAMNVLPLIGLWLFVLPVFWPNGASPGTDQPSTSSALIYVFTTWLALIAGSALLILLKRRYRRPDQKSD